MQKCEIDWPICSHEPAGGGSGDDVISQHTLARFFSLQGRGVEKTGQWGFSFLTCIRDVEEERHRHH
jgi:hypothetical protein